MEQTRRIALIHALRESVEPIRAAFAEGWPQAQTFNLLDDSLAPAVRHAGEITAQIHARFQALARYALGAGDGSGPLDAILFTCSAFGPAIEGVQRALTIPVLKPNEAAFEAALERGRRIGVAVTFEPSLAPLLAELRAQAAARGADARVEGIVVPGALAALQAGDPMAHDTAIAAAAAAAADRHDVIVLGQFSMARARSAMPLTLQPRVLTTPDAAVARLRALLGPQPDTGSAGAA
jgi:Asp/Glu/hydantoin racemase